MIHYPLEMTDEERSYLVELRDKFAVAFASGHIPSTDVWKHADAAMEKRSGCTKCNVPGNIACSKDGCPGSSKNLRGVPPVERYTPYSSDTKDAREHHPPGDKARLDGFRYGWALSVSRNGFWQVEETRGGVIGCGCTIRAAIDAALKTDPHD